MLVTGLLLIGLVANDDGLFAAAGHQLARVARNGGALFAGAGVIIGVTTATLNLDTSVAFLTPVVVYTVRSRGRGEGPLLYGCLLLSNAGSLFLAGSNLTNLIVLGHLHLSGADFLARMWAPALAALAVTAAVVAAFEHRGLRVSGGDLAPSRRPVIGLGLIAVVLATVLVVTLPSSALPVAIAGAALAGIRLAAGKTQIRKVAEVLGVPTLVGLFGVPWRSARSAGSGPGQRRFFPTSTYGEPQPSPPPARSWSTTCPRRRCLLPVRLPTPLRC